MKLSRLFAAPLVLAALAAPAALAQTGDAAAPAARFDPDAAVAPEQAAPDGSSGLVQIPKYLCAQQCFAGSCAQWCSYQQRCWTTCTPQGQAGCYCIF